MDAKQIGTALQRAREDAKLNQERAAELLEVNAVTLSRYENGHRPAPKHIREAAAKLYGVEPERFGLKPARLETSPPVPPGVDAASAWWGRMDEMRQQLGSMSQIAAGLAQMAARAESTVGGLLESGVLTGAAPSGGSRTVAEILAALPPDQRAAAEARAAEILAPHPPPANGRTAPPTPPKRAAGGER